MNTDRGVEEAAAADFVFFSQTRNFLCLPDRKMPNLRGAQINARLTLSDS
jgi:hypothetical protein